MMSSIRKDIDCLLRMYARRPGSGVVDDIVDSPFRELGLLENVPGESHTYRRIVGPKPSLPDAILAFASLDFMDRVGQAHTASMARLALDPGSPGRVFQLSELDIHQSLLRFTAGSRDLHLADPGGVRQLLVSGPPRHHARAILHDYYRALTGSHREWRLADDLPDATPRAARNRLPTDTVGQVAHALETYVRERHDQDELTALGRQVDFLARGGGLN